MKRLEDDSLLEPVYWIKFVFQNLIHLNKRSKINFWFSQISVKTIVILTYLLLRHSDPEENNSALTSPDAVYLISGEMEVRVKSISLIYE